MSNEIYGRPTPLKVKGPQTLLVDFDGTLVEHQWPAIGPMMKNADVVMKRLYSAGHTIIIWTARSDEKAVSEAKAWMAMKGIQYHAFNETPKHLLARYGGQESRKIHADIVVEDHQVGGLPSDWEDIYQVLVDVHGIANTRSGEEEFDYRTRVTAKATTPSTALVDHYPEMFTAAYCMYLSQGFTLEQSHRLALGALKHHHQEMNPVKKHDTGSGPGWASES